MEKYQVTKTIRFKLEVKNENIKKIRNQISEAEKNNDFDLVDFVSDLNNFIGGVSAFLFYEKKDGNSAVKDKMTIKKEWLRFYAKRELAEFTSNKKKDSTKPRRSQITIAEINQLAIKIKNTFDEVGTIYAKLADDAGAELNERAKKARTGLQLKYLSAKKALPFLISLVESLNDKNETNDLSIQLKNQGEKLSKQLVAGIQKYLPEQSNGLSIAKASFNYYTINKNAIDFSGKLELLRSDLKQDFDNGSFKENTFGKGILTKLFDEIKKDIKEQLRGKELWLGDDPMIENEKYASLRQILKNIKSQQKKHFFEFMQGSPTFPTLKNIKDLYLFNNIIKNEFDAFIDKTKAIEKKGIEINQCKNENEKGRLRSDLQKLCKERGSLINAVDKTHKDKFKNYKNFANSYCKVSEKHGRILARLKGIEKERAESQLLNYWAVIVENNHQHQLVLIPKENAAKCKEWIGQSHSENEQTKLYWFESFTFRSLQKLCFGNVENGTNSNSFYPEIEKELKTKYFIDDKHGNKKFLKGEFDLQGDVQKKIQFYKDVLTSKYARTVLKIPFDHIQTEIIQANFETLDEFIIALEKICYSRFVCISDDVLNGLQKFNPQIFEITSLDLRNSENSKNKSDVFEHSDKNFTKIWKAFWEENNKENNFEIRLNPEITISYRKPKESRVKKYGEKSECYDMNKKNRYLHEQFTLISTFSEHSNCPAKDLSFITGEELNKSIEEFNEIFNKSSINFALGIDNGETELSTLGVYLPNFKKDENREIQAELSNVKAYGFKVLTIKNLLYSEKDTNGKERKIVQNPSYFLNKELYCRTFGKTEVDYNTQFALLFEQKYTLSLDLTTAKVINGQIVANGDVPTFLNLWLRHAERSIYDMNDHANNETAKKIFLKRSEDLSLNEKIKFIDYLNLEAKQNKRYEKLSDSEKLDYVNWLYEYWDGNEVKNDDFEKIKKEQRVGYYSKYILFAICSMGKEIHSVVDICEIRNVFKFRKDFDSIKSEDEILQELEKYNTRSLSNEELDLKINHLKQALVANAIGVIDFLYKQYKERLGGEGLIVKEGFNCGKVQEDLAKFSGNIYRIFERKLYQKFQNYGLVPPIKNLLSLRADGVKDDDKTTVMQLGNICFVSKAGTSQECPVCVQGNLRHSTRCGECGFESNNIMHSNDGIAGLNIAKRGFNNNIKPSKN